MLSRGRITWLLDVFPILLGLPVLVITYKRFQLTNLIYFFCTTFPDSFCRRYLYLCRGPSWFLDAGIVRVREKSLWQDRSFCPGLYPGASCEGTSSAHVAASEGEMACVHCCQYLHVYQRVLWTDRIRIYSRHRRVSWIIPRHAGRCMDAQWDMFFALIGAIVSLTLMPGIHDRFLKGIGVNLHYDE